MGVMKIKLLLKSALFLMLFIPLLISLSQGRDYELTPGDEIEVFVWNNPDLSRQLEVKMDGSISMPLVGKIRAEGLTSGELEERLAEEFSEYIKQPGISVIISSHSRWVVSIFGEVRSHTGARRWRISFYEGMGMLDLVAEAGGFTKEARLSRCIVLRRASGEGVRKRYEVNLNHILEGEAPDFMLQAGDIVYIPHTGLSSWNYFIRNVMPTLSFIATLVTMSALLF